MADELSRQVTQAMHAEHMAKLELLGRLERARDWEPWSGYGSV